MSIGESIGISIFLMVVVFVTLFALCLCVRLFSFLIRKIEESIKKNIA
ncbi:OadG family protein [Oscillospiraceae bacterium MB08-C2-2]|nr:OadG family protein [Oscillospiraceae bacterium MB08-C2-2]